jgi:hypothetical protein
LTAFYSRSHFVSRVYRRIPEFAGQRKSVVTISGVLPPLLGRPKGSAADKKDPLVTVFDQNSAAALKRAGRGRNLNFKRRWN